MVLVGGPEQRQQSIDVQKVCRPYHSSSISSTRFVVTTGESGGRIGK
jgi:hypothetical protein